MSPRQIQARVDSGRLAPVHRTVYRLAGGRSAPAQTLPAACLAAGPGAVASHRSAGAGWGLRGVEEQPALMRRLVTFELLGRTPERLGGPGRNGAGVLRAMVEERDPATAPPQSGLEDQLFGVLRRGGLPGPVRQYEVAGVRLDGAYPHIRPGIEADGRIWHGGRPDVRRNTDKAIRLSTRGWRIRRLTWFDVTRRARHMVDAGRGQSVVAWPA